MLVVYFYHIKNKCKKYVLKDGISTPLSKNSTIESASTEKLTVLASGTILFFYIKSFTLVHNIYTTSRNKHRQFNKNHFIDVDFIDADCIGKCQGEVLGHSKQRGPDPSAQFESSIDRYQHQD